jgi:hypothetical protein
LVRPRQHDLELSEKSGLRLDIYAAAMLLYDDVVAHRQAKPGTFARRLGREKWVKYFVFDPVRDARPIIANTDLNLVSEVLRRSGKHWLETVTGFRFSFRCRVEPIRYEIEQDSRDLLRISPFMRGRLSDDEMVEALLSFDITTPSRPESAAMRGRSRRPSRPKSPRRPNDQPKDNSR